MAEVAVAIIRLKLSGLTEKRISSQDFEICIKEEPSTKIAHHHNFSQDFNVTKRVTVGGHTVGADVFKLPTLSFEPAKMTTVEDLIHEYFRRTGNNRIRRVLRIPLHFDNDENQPMCSRDIVMAPGLAMVCVPVFVKEVVEVANSRFENLQKLLNLCQNQPEMFEVHSKNMLQILEKWLQNSCLSSHFISTFFKRENCRERIRNCAHNPAYIEQQEQCFRNLSHSIRSTSSSDLDDRVHMANFAKLAMLKYNKFTISTINPAFWPEDSTSSYFYPGIKKPPKNGQIRASSSSITSSDFRQKSYPIHKSAEIGNVAEIRQLLNASIFDVNQKDDDGWTPLHYASFYGNFEVAIELLNSPQMTAINAQNGGGSTALHYAVINGNEYLVEILTSHASIDVNIQNSEGLRPIDYCTNNPKIRHILELQIFKTKIHVDTVHGPYSIKMARKSDEAQVSEILERLAEETQLTKEQMNCFAIFIYSKSMSLQLRPDSLIEEKLKVDKWNVMIRKLISPDCPTETPRLKLKRNAYATSRMEMITKVDHNKFGRDTLLDEAINAYLHGLLIAGSKEEMAKMAAILARKMHGNSGNGNGMEYKPSAKNLANIYPQYMLDNHDRTKLADRLKIAMKKNETRNDRQLEDDFLSISRGLMTYGASFFEVDVFTTKKNFGNGQALVGVNDHGLHIILKKAWNVKNLRFDEFAAIFRDSKTIEIDAQRSRDLHFIMVSTQMKFLKGILQKFQG